MNRVLSGCLPYAALSLCGVLVLPFVAGAVVFKLVIVLWVMGFGMFSLAKFRHGLESRDKYDLKKLKRVHQMEELRRADVPLVAADADEAYCVHCGEAFASRLPICPRCRRPQGSGLA